jgi:hypothetical protein
VTLPGGEVDLSGVEGVGPEDPTGVPAEEVLVVRPFGRKGEAHTMREFDRAAMQFHFGVQPVEVVGDGVDGDGDGVVNEVTIGELTALHVFDVTNPPPVQERPSPAARTGRDLFETTGCAGCHVPALTTRSRTLPMAFPDVPSEPFANTYFEIDLVSLGFTPVRHPDGTEGVVVPLHADLKRHDMGDGLAESFGLGDISNREFTTARLWGIADTSPYLHDGRATTLHEAIVAHGGEAEDERDAYLALTPDQQRHLIAYLKTLRTPERPNEELVRRRSLDLGRRGCRTEPPESPPDAEADAASGQVPAQDAAEPDGSAEAGLPAGLAAAWSPDAGAWTGRNLFEDAGFEDGGRGWFFLEGNRAWGGFTIVEEPVHSGRRAARLKVEWDPAEQHLRSKVFGLIQEPRPDRFPDVLGGWYRVDAWEKEAEATSLYAQVVVGVMGDPKAARIVAPEDPTLQLNNYQLRYVLCGIDQPPFVMRNGRFVFRGPREPQPGRWVPFLIPVREDFERLWGSTPEGYANLRILVEARWDNRPPGSAVLAEVTYDDLFLGWLD